MNISKKYFILFFLIIIITKLNAIEVLEKYLDLFKNEDKEEVKKQLEEFRENQQINFQNYNEKIIYTYLLGKTEQYREFANEYVPVKLRIRYLKSNEIKEIIEIIDKINLLDINKNKVCENIIKEIKEEIEKRKNVLNPPIKKEEERRVEEKLEININYFTLVNQIERIVKEKKVEQYIHHYLEEAFRESGKYNLSPTAIFQLNGKIQDFKIVDEHKNTEGKVIERRIELLLDYELKEITTNKSLYKYTGLYSEIKYFTEEYSKELGRNEEEVIQELIKTTIENIYKNIDKYFESIKAQIILTKRQIELTNVQKEVLSRIFKKEEVEYKKEIRGTLLVENEHINISGSLENSGEEKKQQNKFTTKENISFIYPIKKGVIKGQIETKTTSYDKNADLERINLDYQYKNLIINLGNIYTNFSALTFNNVNEGMKVKYNYPENRRILEFILGRESRAREHQNFRRYNVGFKLTNNLTSLNNFTIINVYTEDDKNSISYDTSLQPIKNLLFGTTGKIKISESYLIDFEYINSYYANNTYFSDDWVRDAAISLKNLYKKEKFIGYFNYSKIGKNYYTANSVLTTDRQQFLLGCNQNFTLFNYFLTAKIQNDNVNSSDTTTNYLNEYSFQLNYLPFITIDEEQSKIKNFQLTNQLVYRKEYNKISDEERTKDIENISYNLKIKNDLFNKKLRCYAGINLEREKDKILEEKEYTRYFEAGEDIINIEIMKNLLFNNMLKFRYSKYNATIYRYVNGRINLNYSKENINCGFDYLLDISEQTNRTQNSRKHNFILNFEYSYYRVINTTFYLNFTYNINSFANRELEYDKHSIITGLRINF